MLVYIKGKVCLLLFIYILFYLMTIILILIYTIILLLYIYTCYGIGFIIIPSHPYNTPYSFFASSSSFLSGPLQNQTSNLNIVFIFKLDLSTNLIPVIYNCTPINIHIYILTYFESNATSPNTLSIIVVHDFCALLKKSS